MAGNKKGKKISASLIAIIAVAILFVGICIGYIVKHYADIDKRAEEERVRAEQLAATDGECMDYEETNAIKLGEYRGVEVDVNPTEDDVYSEMQSAVEEVKMEGESLIKKGDYVFFDYVGYIDGVESEELQGYDITLKVGDYEFLNELEDGMVGQKVGETHTTNVTFENDYMDETVAGKTVTYSVTINGKINNAYVKKISKNKYKTVEEYYPYLEERLKKENIENIGELAWTELMDACKVKEYPDGHVDATVEDLHYQYESFAELYGTTYEEFILEMGMGESDVVETAKDMVKERMVAKTIAVKEGLTMTDEAYEKYLLQYMEYDEKEGKTLADLETEYKEGTSARPKDDMIIEMVKEFIAEYAKYE